VLNLLMHLDKFYAEASVDNKAEDIVFELPGS
jgi:hypothetical protein